MLESEGVRGDGVRLLKLKTISLILLQFSKQRGRAFITDMLARNHRQKENQIMKKIVYLILLLLSYCYVEYLIIAVYYSCMSLMTE